MSVALYVRTSNNKNDGTAQLRSLRAAAHARGVADQVVEFVETDVTGDTGKRPMSSRPVWSRLWAEISAGRVSLLMVDHIDRIGRDLGDLIKTLDAVYRAGCRVQFVRMSVEWATDEGRLVACVVGALAEYERRQIAKRVSAGIRKAQANGVRFGRSRAALSVGELLGAVQAREDGASWAEVVGLTSVSVSTIRRAVGAVIAAGLVKKLSETDPDLPAASVLDDAGGG